MKMYNDPKHLNTHPVVHIYYPVIIFVRLNMGGQQELENN